MGDVHERLLELGEITLQGFLNGVKITDVTLIQDNIDLADGRKTGGQYVSVRHFAEEPG